MRPNTDHPTRDDVARLAGVSSATVSYVVNRGPRAVSPETHQRVVAAIQQLGYHPDAIARSLRTRHTHVIGLIIPDNTNAFFAELARHLEEAAQMHGYSLLLCNSREDVEREGILLASLRDRRVDGVVLVPSDVHGGSASAELDGIPIVALDRVPPSWEGDAVRADGRAGGVLAANHLLELGHRRIGVIHGPLRLAHARERQEGSLDALRAARIPASDLVHGEAPFTYEGGQRAAHDLLSRDIRPTALCCANDAIAVGALSAAHALSLRVPQDVSIVGFDDVPVAAYTVPSLTTVTQPYTAMAAAAMELLLGRTDRNVRQDVPTVARVRVFPVGFVIRGTTASPTV